MANINQTENEYVGVKSITLSSGISIKTGEIADSGSINGLIISTTSLAPISGIAGSYIVNDIIITLIDNAGIAGTAQLSIGTNAPSYNNIMPSTPLSLSSLNDCYQHRVTGISRKLYLGDVIVVNLTTPYAGTSVTLTIKFFGGASQ